MPMNRAAAVLALTCAALPAAAQTPVVAATWTGGGGVGSAVGLASVPGSNSMVGQSFVCHGTGEVQSIAATIFRGNTFQNITMTLSTRAADGTPGTPLATATIDWIAVAFGPTRPVIPFDFSSAHVVLTDGQAYCFTLSVPFGSAPEAYALLGDGAAGYAEGTALFASFPGSWSLQPNVDQHFTVTILPSTPSCPANFNQDSTVDADDLADYINCYFALPPCDRADFNDDTTVDADDLADFINVFFAGCP